MGPLAESLLTLTSAEIAALSSLVGDPVGSVAMAQQAIDNMRQQQAASLAYFDVFWVCGVAAGPGSAPA